MSAEHMTPMYQARAYYQQNISIPHSYEEKTFTSKAAALQWAKTARDWVFQVDIWQNDKLLVCQTRWSGKNWKHHSQALKERT